MKKYIGTFMDIYVLISYCIILVLSWLLLGAFFWGDRNIEEYIGVLLVLTPCEGVLTYFGFRYIIPMAFNVAVFSETEVIVNSIPPKIYLYSKCVDVGLGFYIHGGYSKHGIIVKYIYLSYKRIPEQKRRTMNLLHTSEDFLKIKYSDEIFNYLVEKMPELQSQMLGKSKEDNINIMTRKFI